MNAYSKVGGSGLCALSIAWSGFMVKKALGYMVEYIFEL